MRRARKASPPIYVRVIKDGKEYEGEYYTTRGLVTVHYRARRKSTTQPGASAAITARMLLRELIDEAMRYRSRRQANRL